MMRIDYDLITTLSAEDAYDIFRTPANWPRLFTAFGEPATARNGWVRVPIRRSPFALKAKVTTAEPFGLVAWQIRGFWHGHGEVHIERADAGTRIRGYEKITPPRMLGWSGLIQRWAQPRFEAVWESGWRQIRLYDESQTQQQADRP